MPELEIWESRISPEREARISAPGWLFLFLGLVGIAGGALGLAALVEGVISGQGGLVSRVILCALALLYILAIWCGVMALQRRAGWLRANTILWVLQVPVLISPIVAYRFSLGASITPYVSVPPLKLGIDFWLGSRVELVFLTPMQFGVGANVVALCLAIYLLRLESRSAA